MEPTTIQRECDRCGNLLPADAHGNQRFCDDCKDDRGRERVAAWARTHRASLTPEQRGRLGAAQALRLARRTPAERAAAYAHQALVRIARRPLADRMCEGCEDVLPPDAHWHKRFCDKCAYERNLARHRKENNTAEEWQRLREKAYIKKYGITWAQRDEMLERQGGSCAICGFDGTLVTHHDHGTLEVKDMLCTPCNTGIGHFSDDPNVVEQALLCLLNN